MATKTISVDLEAYECLRKARRTPTESFSQVIKRAIWPRPPLTAGELLRVLAETPVTEEAVLERLEQAQADDAAPMDPWREP